MSTKIRITRSDILKQKVVPAGWYPCLVKDVEEKAAKSDGSQNWFIELEIKGGPNPDFIGVSTNRVFNEKAPGFAIRYLEAHGQKVGEEGGEFDFHRTKGKMVMAYWKPAKNTETGAMQNSVEDFRQMDQSGAGAPPKASEPPKAS